MGKLSLKNIASNIKEEIVSLPHIGEVKIHEIGMDQQRMLHNFYLKNYGQQHILSDPKLFDWQFANNNKKVLVLSKDGQLIAHHGHIPIIFTNGTDEYKGFISANVVVDEDFRRKGLMSYMLNRILDKYDMTANLGASVSGVNLYNALGYKDYGKLTRLIGIIDPKKCTDICQGSDKLKQVLQLSDSNNALVKPINRFEPIAKQIEQLWTTTFLSPTYFAIKRDDQFLDWRYTSHPYFKYDKYGLWKNDKLVAIIIFRQEKIAGTDSQVIRITELFGQEDAVIDLVNATVLNKKITKDTSWVDWSCPNKYINKILKKLGFVTLDELSPAVVPLLCSPIDYHKTDYSFMFWSRNKKMSATLPDFDQWYITKGDGDADRPNLINTAKT
jgi:GNAT superfamily N-acetyltransferase